MKKLTLIYAVGALLLAPFLASESLADLRLGVGVNYWTTVNDINVDDFDEDGLSFFLSLQMEFAELAKIELAVEQYEEGFGGSPDEVYAPQAFLIFGGGIYAGAGVGMYYVDGDILDDPFFALRAGFDMELLPGIYLDINANYRFEDWNQVNEDDISENTVTLGAAVRVEI